MIFSVLLFVVLPNLAKSEDCNSICTTEWNPVCGTDKVTYGNQCSLEYADCMSKDDIGLDYLGECEPKLRKSRPNCEESMMKENCDLHSYSPICERSGTTYRNMCHLCQSMFEQQKTRNVMYIIAHMGPC
ncbi:four-domain proteases inhibitor-like [Palaemon carinicauda]|uniref:four-domain proteases inhibitor-like n=1 Tax=Palaemon carinicauda TaxID=392227 RepID=UPI0035B5AC0C